MTPKPADVDRFASSAIEWQETTDPDFPYETRQDGVHWKLRINDFPDEPLYSLMREGEHVADFDDWPSHWSR